MQRTQIYLRKDEHESLQLLGKKMGKSMSALIRTAVDRYISDLSTKQRKSSLEKTKGMWADRDVSDFEGIRKEFDRLVPF